MGINLDEENLKKHIIDCMKSLHSRGLMTGVGGNASARQMGEDKAWITPSGLYKPDLNPSDLLKIDLEGKVTEGIIRREPMLTPYYTLIVLSLWVSHWPT
jgi:ribulose-5-phosphate 4-epimerase/fuculose-1-phosphate aldolase